MDLRGKYELGLKGAWITVLIILVMTIEWILLVAGTKPHEMIVGAASVLACGAFLLAVQRTSPLRVDFRIGDLATAWRIPWYVLTGTFQVTVVLFRDLLGIEKAKSLYCVSGFKTSKTDPVLVARRVLATAYATTSPSSIVIGIDYEQSRMLSHQLEPDRPSRMIKELGAQP